MEIKLPKAVADGLPEPGEDGVIRCTAGFKPGKDGKWQIVEVNDSPMPTKDDEEMEEDGMPSMKPTYQELGTL